MNILSLINDLFGELKQFSDSYWFFIIIFTIAALDSVFPIVPSETLVIVGGVSAGAGDLSLALVMGSAFGGAFVGDHMSYFLGRRASHFITRRYERTEKGKRRLESVIHQIHERGGLLLITARFIRWSHHPHPVMRHHPTGTQVVYRMDNRGRGNLVHICITSWLHWRKNL